MREYASDDPDGSGGEAEESRCPHPVDIHVGLRIRLLRKQHGFTQEQLAQAIGVRFQQLQKYERGANRVSASKLWEISRALEVDLAEFFAGYGSAPDLAFNDWSSNPTSVWLSSDGHDLAVAFQRINPNCRRKLIDFLMAASNAR